jgi:hypothetical protein
VFRDLKCPFSKVVEWDRNEKTNTEKRNRIHKNKDQELLFSDSIASGTTGGTFFKYS